MAIEKKKAATVIAKVSSEVKDYSDNSFFVEKAGKDKAFLKRAGLPKIVKAKQS